MASRRHILDTVQDPQASAYRYFDLNNTVVGLASFGFGLACMGTKNPQLYAFIASLFVLLTWHEGKRNLTNKMRLLRNIDHSASHPMHICRRSIVAVFGWAFIGLVATGILTSDGFSL